MEFRTSQGQARYDALVRHADASLVGLDFDGTLAPIVDDPALAHIHPAAPSALTDLARVVRRVAVVTGRPARQVVSLARLDEVADALGGKGLVTVDGQYGNERWASDTRLFANNRAPEGLAAFAAALPGVLASVGAGDAFVEDKHIALAVHTRRLPDPADAFARLVGPIGELADGHGLLTEPGRLVIEVREPGMTKGRALLRATESSQAEAVLFIGDDLGDVDAFRAVDKLRREGTPGLLVCSGSAEENALIDRADLVVDGPAGVVGFLRGLTAAMTARGIS